MKTSCLGVVSRAFVAIVGLLLGAAGCSADASETATAPPRASQLTPNNPPPPRPSTKEACDLCEGIWAVHGIAESETCICKANDEGHDCLDGNDCLGECLLDGDPEFHVMEAGDPPLGYYLGHCAGYDTTFGCFQRIADNIQGQLPLTSEQAGEFVCVD
ncbi:MAG TPA: hypothetical protein VK540_16910 [Polyangiaceae bacterium]|nr:hypothetical protein [Polyangiaceae bacterium]